MTIEKCRNFIIASIIASFSIITGCATNPYTGEPQASRAGLGLGIGAAGGALAGQLIGHNTTSTLVGAALGAAVGGSVGTYMDREAEALRQQLQGTGVSVIRRGHDIQLIMPSDITFAFNSSDIKPGFYSTLNSVSLVLKKYKKTMIRVVGFTDNVGKASYNQILSEQRAQSVATYLMSQGMDPRRFAVLGYGARYPVANNASAFGRSQNRRVEITLQSIQ